MGDYYRDRDYYDRSSRRSTYGDYQRGRDREREDALNDLNVSLFEGDRRSRHVANETRIHQIRRLEEDEREMQRKIQALRAKEREYEDRVRSRMKELDDVGEEFHRTQDQIAHEERHLRELKEIEKEKRERLSVLASKKDEMSHALARKRDQLAALDEETHRARSDLQSTKLELRGYREDLAKLGEMEHRYRREIEGQRSALQRLRADQDSQMRELEHLRRDMDAAEHNYGHLDHGVRRLDEVDRQVRRELDMRRARIDELAHLERQYTSELERLAHARVEYGNAVDRLSAVEDRQRVDLQRTTRELHHLERRLTGDMRGGMLPPPPGYPIGGPPMLMGAPTLRGGFAGTTQPLVAPGIARTGAVGVPTTPFASRVIPTPAKN